MSNLILHHPVDKCFICGAVGETEEHVFDDVLQKHIGLRQKTANLQNFDTRRYNKIKVRCCTRHNNEVLSPIANKVVGALKKGPSYVRDLPKDLILTWLLKIYYGFIVHDSSLRLDKKNPKSSPLITSEDINRYSYVKYLLDLSLNQAVKKYNHSSLFVFDCLWTDQFVDGRFWYSDSLDWPFIAIRVDGTLLIAFLGDFGLVESLDFSANTPSSIPNLGDATYTIKPFDLPYIARSITLNPDQVREMVAFYHSISDLIFPIELKFHDRNIFEYRFIGEYEYKGAPPIHGWDSSRFSTLKKHYLGSELYDLLHKSKNGEDFTLMVDSNNNPLQMYSYFDDINQGLTTDSKDNSK